MGRFRLGFLGPSYIHCLGATPSNEKGIRYAKSHQSTPSLRAQTTNRVRTIHRHSGRGRGTFLSDCVATVGSPTLGQTCFPSTGSQAAVAVTMAIVGGPTQVWVTRPVTICAASMA